MLLEDPSGRTVEAEIVDDYAGGCFDDAVLMVGGDVRFPTDLRGWRLVEATIEERKSLARLGFSSLLAE